MARGELTDSATEKVGDFSEKASSDEATREVLFTVCRVPTLPTSLDLTRDGLVHTTKKDGVRSISSDRAARRPVRPGDMKGNTGRLKRSSSRRWRLAIFLLGVASPFALYWFVTGGGNASGDRLGDSSRLGSWEGGRGFGATHARGHEAGERAMYQGTKNYGGFENGIAGITNRDPSVWDSVSKDPKEHRRRRERVSSPPAPETKNGSPRTIGTKRVSVHETRPGHGTTETFVTNGDDRRNIDAHRTNRVRGAGANRANRDEPVAFDDDLLDAGAESELSDEACASLADEWVESRRKIYAEHTHARAGPRGHGVGASNAADAIRATRDSGPETKSDLLFFLHIPRTAGRTFHFCYLKLAYPEKDRCGKSYDELRVNVHNPNCKFLASHDDYSLVERFREQPKVVTMFRDPVARVLSSYEFAVEVSVRSFGNEASTPTSRVSTRNVWPWSNAVRFIDRDLKRYKTRVERDSSLSKKESIENVYNNTVYSPLHEFVDTPEAREDFHNAQFLQLLGLSTNSNPSTEPKARDLRSCLRPGTAATETLYAYAEERLREEVDVTVTHERLDDALRMTSAELGMSMLGPSFNGASHAPPHSKLLRAALETVARNGQGHVDGSVRDDANDATDATDASLEAGEDSRTNPSVSGGGEIVGFTFRFGKVALEQLKDETWRAGYLDAIVSVLAYTCGVETRNVRVTPPEVKGLWAKDEGGWQTAFVEFPPARVARDGAARAIEDLPPFDPDATGSTGKKRKLGPDELLALARDARDSGENVAEHLVLAAEGFDEYGEMTVHAVGRVALPNENEGGFSVLKRARGKAEVYKLGRDPTFVPLGTAFRACERAQRSKYARLKSKAFASLHKHVSGDFEPFVKDDRAQIAPSLLDHIRDLNFLDDRLHRFAARLFDERFEANEEKIRREVIPPKLPK